MWGQHTELRVKPGKRNDVVRKFQEAAYIQRDNPDCLLLITSESFDHEDAVFLTEIYTSKDAWEAARSRPEIADWAREMPVLVDGKRSHSEFSPVGGKGLTEATA